MKANIAYKLTLKYILSDIKNAANHGYLYVDFMHSDIRLIEYLRTLGYKVTPYKLSIVNTWYGGKDVKHEPGIVSW